MVTWKLQKWLIDRFHLSQELIKTVDFWTICILGHLDFAKWLVETCMLTTDEIKLQSNQILNTICYYGHLNVIVWLIDTLQLHLSNFNTKCVGKHTAFYNVCERAHIPILHLLIARFGQFELKNMNIIALYWESIIENACKEENTFVIMWLCDNFPYMIIPERNIIYVEQVLLDKNIDDDIMVKPAAILF